MTQSSGVLASALSDNRGLGTGRCPWVLQAKRGQRLNITLIDFGLAKRYHQQDAKISSLICQRYANIKEPQSRSSTLCGGEQRMRNVYVSDGNTVEIEIIPAKNSKSSAAFLLKYEGKDYVSVFLSMCKSEATFKVLHHQCVNADKVRVVQV